MLSQMEPESQPAAGATAKRLAPPRRWNPHPKGPAEGRAGAAGAVERPAKEARVKGRAW